MITPLRAFLLAFWAAVALVLGLVFIPEAVVVYLGIVIVAFGVAFWQALRD